MPPLALVKQRQANLLACSEGKASELSHFMFKLGLDRQKRVGIRSKDDSEAS